MGWKDSEDRVSFLLEQQTRPRMSLVFVGRSYWGGVFGYDELGKLVFSAFWCTTLRRIVVAVKGQHTQPSVNIGQAW